MKTIAALLFCVCPFVTQSQIVELHTFDDGANQNQMVYLEISGMKYVQVMEGDENNRFIYLYNPDFTLWKTIDCNGLPALETDWGFNYSYLAFYISETLFDLDEDLEFMFLTSSYEVFTGIYNEDGTAIIELNGGYPSTQPNLNPDFGPIYNTPDGARMLVNFFSSGLKVYSLPGTLFNPCCTEIVEGVSEWNEHPLITEPPYPNPTTNSIRIDYTLPQGVNVADLKIFDMQGNIVKSVQVGKAFDHVLLDLSALAAGTYLYQVGEQAAQQLVKL